MTESSREWRIPMPAGAIDLRHDAAAGEAVFDGTKQQLRELAHNCLAVSAGNFKVRHEAGPLVEVGTRCSKRLIEALVSGYAKDEDEDHMVLEIFKGLQTEQPPDLNAAMLTAVLVQVARDTLAARRRSGAL